MCVIIITRFIASEEIYLNLWDHIMVCDVKDGNDDNDDEYYYVAYLSC